MQGNQESETGSLPMLKSLTKSARVFLLWVLFAAVTVRTQTAPLADHVPGGRQRTLSPGHYLVLLLDVNPHQKKVLPKEITLAEGIIGRLARSGNVSFSVITFGTQMPKVIGSRLSGEEGIATIRRVNIEQAKERYFSVHFYDALSLAMDQLSDENHFQSLLVISEGNDYFPPKTFQETVATAHQLQVPCDVAMIADHTFYGTKGIQHYGFELRRLAGKTNGEYVEVGGGQRKLPQHVDRISEGILHRRLK
jgi:hypothetical protein